LTFTAPAAGGAPLELELHLGGHEVVVGQGLQCGQVDRPIAVVVELAELLRLLLYLEPGGRCSGIKYQEKALWRKRHHVARAVSWLY
jgi:hypothetical protein